MIRHTIISWDCSFRNFFHLIDGILCQDYDLSLVELIFVEQRTREFADQYNHRQGLESLSAISNRLANHELHLHIEYLGDDPKIPYHLGRCVNKGLLLAKGEIISVMDGDILLPPNFLKSLEEFHKSGAGVVNLVRRMAPSPVGADMQNWKKGIADYGKCLSLCPDKHDPIPRVVSNKGPMISALREAWRMVNGYDEHMIWSTGLSRLGQDVTARLEIYCGVQSKSLPNIVAVHPYHPAGFSRVTLDSVRILSLQNNLIDWARNNKSYNWKDRVQYTEEVAKKNLSLIYRIHNSSLSIPNRENRRNRYFFGSSVTLGRIYKLYWHAQKKFSRALKNSAYQKN